MVERILRKNYSLLQAIHTAQLAFIEKSEPLSNILQVLLTSIVEITESEYGYIGKVTNSCLPNTEEDSLQTIAMMEVASGSAEAHSFIPLGSINKWPVLPNLLDKIRQTKQPLILEDISTSDQTPCAFLGIPVLYDQHIIAVVSLAGCKIGYPDNMISFMTPVAETCAAMLQASPNIHIYSALQARPVNKKLAVEPLLNVLPWAWYVADFETDTILYSNHSFCKLWNIGHIEFSLNKGELIRHSKLKPYLLRLLADQASLEKVNFFNIPTLPDSAEFEITFTDNRVIRVITSHLENNINQVAYVFEDITARKQQEAVLVQAKYEAEEQATAKQQFLSAMSHEIRTPMNAVLGMTHLLLQENPRPEQTENLQTLKFSSENLLVLINDILDLSKIESGKMIFEETDFDLKELVYNLKRSLNYKAEEKGIKMNTRLDPSLPDVLVGDPVRLAQVLNNLMSNAVKFTEEGSVTIDIMLESDEGQSLKLNFAIIDTGIGISKDKLEYIFDSFTQENTDITRRFGGTGLGLAITRRLLELQNSQIHVESSIGKGSVFYFTLAFKRSLKEKLTPATKVNNYTHVDLSHIQLLLVEDNEINQIVATKFLKQLNIKPDCASNGRIALEKVKTKPYDLILMDLQMPEMGGYEATKAIRDLGGRYTRIPIIAVTAAVVLDTRNRALAVGITDFTAKPINPNELFQKIIKYLSADKNEGSKAREIHSMEKFATVNSSVKQRALYTSLIEVCAGDTEAQHQIITLAKQSFSQFKTKYQKALLSKDAALLDSAAHYMKTLFHVLKEEDLIQEVHHGKRLLEDAYTSAAQLKLSVTKVTQLCDSILGKLEQMSQDKISA